jgi:hypothetical protein
MSESNPTTQVEYRAAPGFPGYRIGDDGSVWSAWRSRGNGGGFIIDESRWHRLSFNKERTGRPVVRLQRDGKTYQFLVYRLVLAAFVGPCPPGMEACHFPDPSPFNNRLGNLRWDTRKGNARDRILTGTNACGSKINHAKIVESDIPEIFRLYASGLNQKGIASRYGLGRKEISRIIRRDMWRHVSVDSHLIEIARDRLRKDCRLRP